MTIQATVMLITPAKAAEYLSRNTINRPLKPHTVHRYAAAMASGRWKLNGESIVIAENGMLINGQHRLQAVVESQVPIHCLVVNGIDAASFDTLDRGITRSIGDVLAIGGYDKAMQLAAGARALHVLRLHNGVNVPPGFDWDTQVAADVVRANPDLKDAVEYVLARDWKRMLPGSWLIALWVELHRKDYALAQLYFEGLATGAGLHDGHPVLVLRERLLSEASRKRLGKHLNLRDRVAIAIKAWNFLRDGHEVMPVRLLFRTGKGGEQFPQVG